MPNPYQTFSLFRRSANPVQNDISATLPGLFKRKPDEMFNPMDADNPGFNTVPDSGAAQGWQGELGKGNPNQTPVQAISQASQSLNGGNPITSLKTGAPNSISTMEDRPTFPGKAPQPLSMPTAEKPYQIPMTNSQGQAALPLKVRELDTDGMQALINQINTPQVDPYQAGKDALAKRGTGKKILGAVTGALSGLGQGGLGGLVRGAIEGERGLPEYQRAVAEQTTRNATTRQGLLDKLKAQYELGGLIKDARQQDLGMNTTYADIGKNNNSALNDYNKTNTDNTKNYNDAQEKTYSANEKAWNDDRTQYNAARGHDVGLIQAIKGSGQGLPEGGAANYPAGTVFAGDHAPKDPHARQAYTLRDGSTVYADPTNATEMQAIQAQGGEPFSNRPDPAEKMPTPQEIHASAKAQARQEYMDKHGKEYGVSKGLYFPPGLSEQELKDYEQAGMGKDIGEHPEVAAATDRIMAQMYKEARANLSTKKSAPSSGGASPAPKSGGGGGKLTPEHKKYISKIQSLSPEQIKALPPEKQALVQKALARYKELGGQ